MHEFHALSARRIHLVFATAAFVHGAFDFFLGLAGAFLDAANQFVFFALDKLEVVIRKLCEFLFQLALGNVPVTFDGQSAHIIFCLFLPRDSRDKNSFCKSRAERLKIIFPKNQVFDACQNVCRKFKLKNVANCTPTPFVGLQVALF
jgi:hypothetical protein